ncbi:hypothetical protein SPI_06542 [Niveomyces insectorum RCEF 264]|uniref:2EXR domain-containing protein n=1 Tax=Niveomyces insectorum RCEF 264 TaxID=1081102 RepID=A0A167RCP4_9HYPO|nr:hypothetical protein SPI_06542 [Niveomyces insectorum RCEF 264]
METRARLAKRRQLNSGEYSAVNIEDEAESSSALPSPSLLPTLPPFSPRTPDLPPATLTPPPTTMSSSVPDACSLLSAISTKPTAEAVASSAESDTPPAFPKFQELPPELRVCVWRAWRQMAAQPVHPLRVRLYRGYEPTASCRSGHKRQGSRKSVPRLTAMPDLGPATKWRRDLLCVCREARYEFLREWHTPLVLDREHVLHIDPAHDIVFFDIANPFVVDDLVDLHTKGTPPAFLHAIGHIAFDMPPQLPHWSLNSRMRLDPRLDLLLCFANLHSISLVNFGTFRPEMDWDDRDDVAWFLSRSRSHLVHFRGFPALAGVNYAKQCAVGRRTGRGRARHDCVICTIHKCVYVRDFLRNQTPAFVQRPELTEDQNAWLAGLSFHTLVLSTPEMAGILEEYDGGQSDDERGDEDGLDGHYGIDDDDSDGDVEDDDDDEEDVDDNDNDNDNDDENENDDDGDD